MFYVNSFSFMITPTAEIYTLSLHDALPISADAPIMILALTSDTMTQGQMYDSASTIIAQKLSQIAGVGQERKSTRQNSSHVETSYADICLKKKNVMNIISNDGSNKLNMSRK